MSNLPMATDTAATLLDGFGQETGPVLFLQGATAPGDGLGGFFTWNQYLTGTPPTVDGVNIFGSNFSSDARFERFTNWQGPSSTVTQSTPSRGLNSSFVISSDYNCFATYSVSIAALLLAGATVFLEISPDNSSWQTVSQTSVSLGLTVTIGTCLYAFVPKTWYARLRTSGSATVTILTQQEALI